MSELKTMKYVRYEDRRKLGEYNAIYGLIVTNRIIKYLQKENVRLINIINELEEYTTENIEVLENRLNSPFCNFEKVTKELLIFQNYLDKLKELKENNKDAC